MSDGESRVINPKIFEYLAKPESERVAAPSEDFSTDANKQESQKELQTALALAVTPPNPQPEKNKRGFFSFLGRKPKAEIQKKLPSPKLFECSLCGGQFESKDIFTHWYASHTVVVRDDPEKAENNSPLRSKPKQRSMVFIVRRPSFYNYTEGNKPFADPELAIAQYFAQVIIMLKQERPGTHFQYIPTNTGELGLITLMVVAEWEEE